MLKKNLGKRIKVKVSIYKDIFRKWHEYSENWANNGVVRLMWAPRHKSEFYVLEIPSSSSINDIGSFCQRKGKYWLIIEICFNFGKPRNWDHDIAIGTGKSFYQRGDPGPSVPSSLVHVNPARVWGLRPVYT